MEPSELRRPVHETDILSAVEKEVIGRSTGHRACYFDLTYDVGKIARNISKSDGITLLPSEIETALTTLVKRLVSDHLDMFTLSGIFHFDNQLTFKIKVLPKPLPVENKGSSETPVRTITSAEFTKNGFDQDPYSREYVPRRKR